MQCTYYIARARTYTWHIETMARNIVKLAIVNLPLKKKRALEIAISLHHYNRIVQQVGSAARWQVQFPV